MGLSQAKPAGGNPLSLLMVHYQKQNCNLYQVQSKVKQSEQKLRRILFKIGFVLIKYLDLADSGGG